MNEAKPFVVEKRVVMEFWLQVKANCGSAGIDGIDLKSHESNLQKNLYTLWNRMSSGRYFPKAVKLVEIPKPNGGSIGHSYGGGQSSADGSGDVC